MHVHIHAHTVSTVLFLIPLDSWVTLSGESFSPASSEAVFIYSYLFFKKKGGGIAGEIAQQLGALTAFPENPGLIPSTYMMVYSCL